MVKSNIRKSFSLILFPGFKWINLNTFISYRFFYKNLKDKTIKVVQNCLLELVIGGGLQESHTNVVIEEKICV